MNEHVKVAMVMDNGSLTVLSFVTKSRSPTLPSGARWVDEQAGLWERPPTDKNVQDEINKAFPGVNQLGMKRPKCVKFQLISESAIPQNRDYRNSWKMEDNKIVEDLEKAKQIHRDKLRNKRVQALLPLDVKWSRAMANNDAMAAAEAEKERQKLRDLPNDPRIDAAQTTEELRQLGLALQETSSD